MIARIWHGIVPKEKADSYYEYLTKTGLQDYENVKGNINIKVLRKDENKITHYLLISFWDSYESIKRFAGDEFEKAKYYPEDKDYLLELESFVNHYEIIVNDLK